MLSARTMKFYRGLWAQLRAHQGLQESDRKPLHARLWLPQSSADFSPENFDQWKGHVLSVTQAGNVTAQLAQMRMPATRKLVFIGHLLCALGEGEEHAERLVSELRATEGYMRRGGDGRMGGKFTTLQTLSLKGLDAVRNKLKDECRARWPRKEYLLGEISALRLTHDFDETAARAEVLRSLNVAALPELPAMVYEDLLVVLSALRMQVPGAPAFVAVPEPVESEMDCPF